MEKGGGENTLLIEPRKADSDRVNGTNESRGLKADRDFLFRQLARGVSYDGALLSEVADNFALLTSDEGGEDRLSHVFADKFHRTVTQGKLTPTSVKAVETIASHVGAHGTRTTVAGTVVQRALQPVFKHQSIGP